MKLILVILLTCACLAVIDAKRRQKVKVKNKKDRNGDDITEEDEQAYEKFLKRKNGKRDEKRFLNFVENRRKIERNNKELKAKNCGWELGENDLADLSEEEFKKTRCAARHSTEEKSNLNVSVVPELRQLAATVDLRDRGGVRVYDQGDCGSCWAFSAASNVEIAYWNIKRQNITISRQNLVDCVFNRDGCHGGGYDYALPYIKDNGVNEWSAYPYVSGTTGTWNAKCQTTNLPNSIKINDARYLGDESKIASVLNMGYPVSVAINADLWQFYKSGIFKDERCLKNSPDHDVVVIGYGEENGVPYWIILNSWGGNWGEKGTIRLERGVNMCGLGWLPYAVTLGA